MPVVGDRGSPPQMLDVARCLFDVIEMLEQVRSRRDLEISAASRSDLGDQPTQVHAAGSALLSAVESGADAAAAVLAPTLQGVLQPTLATVAASSPPLASINATASLREAAAMLSRSATGVLVLGDAEGEDEGDEGGEETARIAGLVTPRSILRALVAGAAETAPVTDGMAPPPLLPPRTASVLDALHMLQVRLLWHAVVVPCCAMCAHHHLRPPRIPPGLPLLAHAAARCGRRAPCAP